MNGDFRSCVIFESYLNDFILLLYAVIIIRSMSRLCNSVHTLYADYAGATLSNNSRVVEGNS